MSIATITEAQRMALRSAAVALEHRSQHWAQNGRAPNAAAVTSFQPIGDAAAAALAVAGHGAGVLPSTAVVLQSGVKVNAVAVTGSGNFATPTIVNGAITGIVLSAS